MASSCDVESGRGWQSADNSADSVRWGFIRKVYGILMTQLTITAIVAGIVVFVDPVNRALANHSWLLIIFAVLALIMLLPIYCYRQSHPLNLFLLFLFTIFESLLIGFLCAFTKGEIVLQVLILTATITIGLTLFTFWAVNRGWSFNFLGPFLFAGLLMLIVWGIIQAFLPLVPIVTSVYAALGALLFCGYIVYDTYNLIQMYNLDDYVWASLALYIDIINLFLMLLQLMRGRP